MKSEERLTFTEIIGAFVLIALALYVRAVVWIKNLFKKYE